MAPCCVNDQRVIFDLFHILNTDNFAEYGNHLMRLGHLDSLEGIDLEAEWNAHGNFFFKFYLKTV